MWESNAGVTNIYNTNKVHMKSENEELVTTSFLCREKEPKFN